MVSDKMGAICPDFKGLGFKISDPIQIPDYSRGSNSERSPILDGS